MGSFDVFCLLCGASSHSDLDYGTEGDYIAESEMKKRFPGLKLVSVDHLAKCRAINRNGLSGLGRVQDFGDFESEDKNEIVPGCLPILFTINSWESSQLNECSILVHDTCASLFQSWTGLELNGEIFEKLLNIDFAFEMLDYGGIEKYQEQFFPFPLDHQWMVADPTNSEMGSIDTKISSLSCQLLTDECNWREKCHEMGWTFDNVNDVCYMNHTLSNDDWKTCFINCTLSPNMQNRSRLYYVCRQLVSLMELKCSVKPLLRLKRKREVIDVVNDDDDDDDDDDNDDEDGSSIVIEPYEFLEDTLKMSTKVHLKDATPWNAYLTCTDNGHNKFYLLQIIIKKNDNPSNAAKFGLVKAYGSIGRKPLNCSVKWMTEEKASKDFISTFSSKTGNAFGDNFTPIPGKYKY